MRLLWCGESPFLARNGSSNHLRATSAYTPTPDVARRWSEFLLLAKNGLSPHHNNRNLARRDAGGGSHPPDQEPTSASGSAMTSVIDRRFILEGLIVKLEEFDEWLTRERARLRDLATQVMGRYCLSLPGEVAGPQVTSKSAIGRSRPRVDASARLALPPRGHGPARLESRRHRPQLSRTLR